MKTLNQIKLESLRAELILAVFSDNREKIETLRLLIKIIENDEKLREEMGLK